MVSVVAAAESSWIKIQALGNLFHLAALNAIKSKSPRQNDLRAASARMYERQCAVFNHYQSAGWFE